MPSEVSLRDRRVRRGLAKEFADVLDAADSLGWSGRRTKNALLLMPPRSSPVSPVHVPYGKQDTTLANRLMHLVKKGSDDALVAAYEAEREGRRFRVVDSAFGLFVEAEVKEDEVTAVAEQEVTVTDRRPWLARVGSDGKESDFYESDSVIERTWSDGSKDYACPFGDECFTSGNPRSVASHTAARHTRRGEKEPVGVVIPVAFDVPVEGFNIQRQQSTIDRLAREIEAAMAEMEPLSSFNRQSELARALAEKMVERRGDRPEVEHDPLTPEQTLARITRLVAAPVVAERDALKEDLAAATETMRAMAQASEAQRKDLVAIKEMLNSITGGVR